MDLSIDKLLQILKYYNVPTYANNKSEEMVGADTGNSGWLDKQDAARHLLGIGELGRLTHPIIAKGVGSLYEMVTGSYNKADADMDKHNNELALSLVSSKSREELEDRVRKLLQTATKGEMDKTKAYYIK